MLKVDYLLPWDFKEQWVLLEHRFLGPSKRSSVTAMLSARSGTGAAPGGGGHALGRDGDALYPDLPRR